MTSELLLALLIAIVILEATVQTVAEVLQLRHQPSQPPKLVASDVDAAAYGKAQAYARARVRLTWFSRAVTVAVTVIAFATGLLGAGYDLVASWTGDGWLTPLAFLALVGLAMDLITLPFSLYATFNVEERFGFNRTTPALFARDKLVSYAITAVLGGGLLALLVVSINLWGREFWIPYAVVLGVLVTLLAMFQTSVLLPLFNKLTPLGDGPLRDAIDDYVKNSPFKLDDVYVMDGSKRSSKANAFFSGLGQTRKVVLFDTLIEKHDVDSAVAVVAHEVGHAVHRHVPKFLIGNLVTITLMLFALSRIVDSSVTSQALGAQESVLAINLIVFGVLFGPLGTLIGVVVNGFSRRFEYQADAFAARTTSPQAMAKAMRSFVKDELSLPVAHPFYAWLNLSHPAPVDRIRAIEASSGTS